MNSSFTESNHMKNFNVPIHNQEPNISNKTLLFSSDDLPILIDKTTNQKIEVDFDEKKSNFSIDKKELFQEIEKSVQKILEKNEIIGLKSDSNFYKINIRKSWNGELPPKQLVFNLVENQPKKSFSYENIQLAPEIQSHSKLQYSKPITELKRKKTNNEIYYFDHGNAAYYKIQDPLPITHSERIAGRTENITAKFWGDVFGGLHIAVALFMTFFHQFLKFLFFSIIQQVIIKPIQIISDNFLKPLFIALFNDIIQPPLILMYNIITSIRDLCSPIIETFGLILRELAILVRSFRLVQINKGEPLEDGNKLVQI